MESREINVLGPLPHFWFFFMKKDESESGKLSSSPTGPVHAVISVNVADSIVECLDLDNYRI